MCHQVNSNDYTQHSIILKKIEKTSLNYPYMPPDLMLWLTLSGSEYQCLELISMTPKMFDLLKLLCINLCPSE